MDVIKPCLNTIFLLMTLLVSGFVMINKRSTFSKVLMGTGLSLMFLLSFMPMSNFLLWRLEARYPPRMDLREHRDAKYVVVLTAWDSDQKTIPYMQNLGYRSASRILEAHRIFAAKPDRRILISGSRHSAELMRDFLKLLDVREDRIEVDISVNTLMSARGVGRKLRGNPFFLVTSAVHMPRSIFLFSLQGVNPIPAPADFLYGYYPEYRFPVRKPISYYVPSTEALMLSSAALYEYFGLAWYRLMLAGDRMRARFGIPVFGIPDKG